MSNRKRWTHSSSGSGGSLAWVWNATQWGILLSSMVLHSKWRVFCCMIDWPSHSGKEPSLPLETTELSYPFADILSDGRVILGKLKGHTTSIIISRALTLISSGTGGELSRRMCKEQLVYEIHDPRHYLTPDVDVDFSRVNFEEVSPDCVVVSQGTILA